MPYDRYTPDVLQGINHEQYLLEMEQRQNPLLQTLIAGKLPYDQLWTTALNFQSMSKVWMNGKAITCEPQAQGRMPSCFHIVCVINS